MDVRYEEVNTGRRSGADYCVYPNKKRPASARRFSLLPVAYCLFPAFAPSAFHYSLLPVPYRLPLGRRQLRRHLLRHERLNGIAHLNIGEVRDPDAALHAVRHFAHIVLKAFQRGQLAFVDRRAIPH